MIKPLIVINEQQQPQPAPPTPFVVSYSSRPLLSERMGLPRKEIPAWARSFDWSAEEDDE